MNVAETENINSNLSNGNRLFVSGKTELAIKEYMAALSKNPDFYVYHENIGWCYERLNDHFNAKKFYKKALELNPNAIRAKFFVDGNLTIENGTIKNKPLFFPQIHEAAAAVDKQSLKDEYFEKKLHLKKDDFALIRIIGNDLYPRHKIGQSRENVAFILENEPTLEHCRKVWVVNRIFDKEELSKILSLLDTHKQEYYVIPFIEAEYKTIGLDYTCLPSPDFLHSEDFEKLSIGVKQRALVSMLRLKNNYVMNNNGARNYALNLGKTLAKWALPWDGNCFMNKASWDAMVKGVLDEPYLKHFVVPMARITSNKLMLDNEHVPDASEEPQIIFRHDSQEKFNENFSYGRRPKVELFWRLGIPGAWDTYKDDQWDLPRLPTSLEAHQFGIAGWTARLFSGMAEQETQNSKGSANRNSARQIAIITAIHHIDKKFNLDKLHNKNLISAIEQTTLSESEKKGPEHIITKTDNGRRFSFISNRNDGLGERLKAMLNAIVMAKMFQRKFHIFWPSEVSAGKEFHAIDSKEYIFSKNYVEENFIEKEFLSKIKISPLSGINNIQEIFTKSEADSYVCHQNEKFSFLQEAGGTIPGIYKEAFDSIKFSESICNAISAAKNINIGEKAAAIHIRGGDIIYGRYRLSQRYQNKAICFPLVIALIDKLKKQGFTPVIFLQDKAVERELRHEKFNGIILARDYSNPFDTTEQAFFEITLMSRCQLILAGTSGFAEVAARISGIKVTKNSDYLSKNESISAIKNWLLGNEKIDSFQHSFALLNYVLIGEDIISTKEIDEALTQAEINDPENGLYPAKRVLNFWKNSDFYSANMLIDNHFRKFENCPSLSIPLLQSLSARTTHGLAMLKYFSDLPHFNYEEFDSLGIIYCYIKFLTDKITEDNECIKFLKKTSLDKNHLSEHAKYIINLIG